MYSCWLQAAASPLQLCVCVCVAVLVCVSTPDVLLLAAGGCLLTPAVCVCVAVLVCVSTPDVLLLAAGGRFLAPAAGAADVADSLEPVRLLQSPEGTRLHHRDVLQPSAVRLAALTRLCRCPPCWLVPKPFLFSASSLFPLYVLTLVPLPQFTTYSFSILAVSFWNVQLKNCLISACFSEIMSSRYNPRLAKALRVVALTPRSVLRGTIHKLRIFYWLLNRLTEAITNRDDLIYDCPT